MGTAHAVLEVLELDVDVPLAEPGDRRRERERIALAFGAVAGLHAEMIVVPPQVAIVGAGRAFARSDRRILPLSVTFDHRVITGVEACQFLLALTQDLELSH